MGYCEIGIGVMTLAWSFIGFSASKLEEWRRIWFGYVVMEEVESARMYNKADSDILSQCVSAW